MAYYRGNYRRTYRRRKRGNAWTRTGRRVGGAIGTVANAAYKGVKYLEGLINVESHFHDGSVSSQEITTTASEFSFTKIAIGDTNGTRTGNSILLKWIKCHAHLIKNGGVTVEQVRIVIVVDKQQIADTSVVFGDVVDTSLGNALIGPYKKVNAGRYNVIYDKLVTLHSNKPQAVLKIFRRMPKKFHVRYNGSNDTDIQKNGIYMFMISSSATPSGPTVDLHHRTKFYDN